jgi:hypothetical protein
MEAERQMMPQAHLRERPIRDLFCIEHAQEGRPVAPVEHFGDQPAGSGDTKAGWR